MAERKNDFHTCRTAITSIIARVARERLSHNELLALRTALCAMPEWQRLSRAHLQELYGMVNGAVDAWHACGALVWCHEYQGHIYTAADFSLTGLPYSVLDTSLSAHRWAADLDRRF